MVTLHRLLQAPNIELFFSSLSNGTLLMTTIGRFVPSGVLIADMRGLDGRKNGERRPDGTSDVGCRSLQCDSGC